MTKITDTAKVAVSLAGFLLLALPSLCQSKTTVVPRQDFKQKEYTRLAALLDGSADAVQYPYVITNFASTETDELVENTQQASLKEFTRTIALLKTADGKLLAVRETNFAEGKDEQVEITHYFDQNGKTFAFTQQESYADFGKVVYGSRTFFFDSNMKTVGRTDSYTYQNGKPAAKEDHFQFTKYSGLYATSKEFQSEIDQIPLTRFNENFTRDIYFQITGRGFKKSAETNKKSHSVDRLDPADRTDTLKWFSNIPSALNYAKQNYKYLVVYYEQANCRECNGSFEDAVERVNIRTRLFDPVIFNENFVLVKATESDTMLLKQAGIISFPGAAFFSADNLSLLTISNTRLDEILLDLARNLSVSNSYKNEIQLHYLNTHSQHVIRKAKFDSQLVRQYLVSCIERNADILSLQEAQEKEAVYQPLVAPPLSAPPELPNSEKKKTTCDTDLKVGTIVSPADERRVSLLNFKVDSAFIQEALDSFVVKNNKPDPYTATLVIQVMHLIDMSDDPVVLSSFLTNKDSAFEPAKSYSYLLKNFQHFKKVPFPKYHQQEHAITAYEVLNKLLGRFIANFDGSDTTSIRRALLLQKEMVDAMPEFEHLGKPLLINELVDHADKFSSDDLLFSVALPYLDKLLSSGPTLQPFVSTTAARLFKDHPKEIEFVLTEYSSSDYENTYPRSAAAALRRYVKNSISSLLNDVAWHLYETKTHHNLLNKALQYANAAILLKPTDPYALDTYAHLLYAKGNRTAAIAHDENALRYALAEMKNDEFDGQWKELVDLIKVSLSKMKAGKLE
jgi:protein-disulfide isomerase